MAKNRVKGPMPPEVKDQILQHLKDACSLAKPFLVNLTAKERQALRKMGPASVDFVQINYEAYKQFPEIYPAAFGGDDFVLDVEILSPLNELRMITGELNASLNDTVMLAGSEAMVKSDESYELIKGRARRDGRLKSIYERVKARYLSNKNKGNGKDDNGDDNDSGPDTPPSPTPA